MYMSLKKVNMSYSYFKTINIKNYFFISIGKVTYILYLLFLNNIDNEVDNYNMKK